MQSFEGPLILLNEITKVITYEKEIIAEIIINRKSDWGGEKLQSTDRSRKSCMPH